MHSPHEQPLPCIAADRHHAHLAGHAVITNRIRNKLQPLIPPHRQTLPEPLQINPLRQRRISAAACTVHTPKPPQSRNSKQSERTRPQLPGQAMQ